MTFKLSAIRAHLAEGDEALPALIPQHQSHTPDALKQSKPAHAVEARIVVQHERQSVVWDTAAQMMDVVNADISGEPAQDAREGIMRAAVKRHLLQVPSSVVSPYGILELVLDVEQPDTGRGREQHDR